MALGQGARFPGVRLRAPPGFREEGGQMGHSRRPGPRSARDDHGRGCPEGPGQDAEKQHHDGLKSPSRNDWRDSLISKCCGRFFSGVAYGH